MENQIDQQINNLQNISDKELYEIIGAYALSQEPQDLSSVLALNNRIDELMLREKADIFLLKIKPVIKDAICGKDGIASYIENPSVKDVINLFLPALGISTVGLIPTALIAVSLIIIRSGLREYCSEN